MCLSMIVRRCCPLIHRVLHVVRRLRPQCGGGLIQRADDTEAIVKQRLDIYNKQTAPLIEFYMKQGILRTFDIKRGMGDLPDLVTLFQSLGFQPKA